MKLLGWALIQWDWCPSKKREVTRGMYEQRKTNEDTVRNWLSESQKEKAQEKSNLLTPQSYTSSF